MQLYSVASSNLDSVGYSDGVMRIHFKSGSLYEYHNVTESLYIDLISAPSIGKFFSDNIKNNPRYPCYQIT